MKKTFYLMLFLSNLTLLSAQNTRIEDTRLIAEKDSVKNEGEARGELSGKLKEPVAMSFKAYGEYSFKFKKTRFFTNSFLGYIAPLSLDAGFGCKAGKEYNWISPRIGLMAGPFNLYEFNIGGMARLGNKNIQLFLDAEYMFGFVNKDVLFGFSEFTYTPLPVLTLGAECKGNLILTKHPGESVHYPVEIETDLTLSLFARFHFKERFPSEQMGTIGIFYEIEPAKIRKEKVRAISSIGIMFGGGF